MDAGDGIFSVKTICVVAPNGLNRVTVTSRLR
jgi:hypothetical protein